MLSLDWLAQAVTGNILTEVLLSIGGGAVLAAIKVKYPDLASWLLYGLGVSALIFVCLTMGSLPRQISLVNVSNPQDTVKQWLSGLGSGVLEQQDVNTEFELFVTMQDGNKIAIARPKISPNKVLISLALSMRPREKVVLDKMTKPDQDRFRRNLRLEFARARVPYYLSDNGQIINFVQMLSIRELTESQFLAAIETLEHDATLASVAADNLLNIDPETP